jgi:hypothetical protein
MKISYHLMSDARCVSSTPEDRATVNSRIRTTKARAAGEIMPATMIVIV